MDRFGSRRIPEDINVKDNKEIVAFRSLLEARDSLSIMLRGFYILFFRWSFAMIIIGILRSNRSIAGIIFFDDVIAKIKVKRDDKVNTKITYNLTASREYHHKTNITQSETTYDPIDPHIHKDWSHIEDRVVVDTLNNSTKRIQYNNSF